MSCNCQQVYETPWDLKILSGVTFGPYVLQCRNEAGEAVDLTGWRVYAEARRAPNQPMAFGLWPTVTDAAAGEITLKISPDQTAALPVGAFGWDLILEDPDGERHGPVLGGRVTVQKLHTQLT
jgi:hypothetical protein